MIVTVVYNLIALTYKVVVVHFMLKLRVEMNVLGHKVNSTYWTSVYECIGVAFGFLSENVLGKTG